MQRRGCCLGGRRVGQHGADQRGRVGGSAEVAHQDPTVGADQHTRPARFPQRP